MSGEKVFLVTVDARERECGVTFLTGIGTRGRIPLALPDNVRAIVLEAAQKALDAATGELVGEVQSTKLTTELHRVRNAQQELEVLKADQARSLDEHGKRFNETKKKLDAYEARLEVVTREAEARRIELEEREAQIEARKATKDALEKDIAELATPADMGRGG
jgi:hypothetical protein